MRKTEYEVEYDINQIFAKIGWEYDLEGDYSGDCYPDEIHTIQIKAQMNISEDDYNDLMEEAEEIARSCAKSYIEFQNEENL